MVPDQSETPSNGQLTLQGRSTEVLDSPTAFVVSRSKASRPNSKGLQPNSDGLQPICIPDPEELFYFLNEAFCFLLLAKNGNHKAPGTNSVFFVGGSGGVLSRFLLNSARATSHSMHMTDAISSLMEK